MSPRSTHTTPAPLQCGHAPSEFAENSPGLTPWALAKALRIESNAAVQVAGLDVREPRIADWSTNKMRPESTNSCGKHAINEDLPDPATPVIALSCPKGISTSIFLKLLTAAPRISIAPVASRTASLTVIRS